MSHPNKRKYNEFNTEAVQNASRKRVKQAAHVRIQHPQGHPQGRGLQSGPQPSAPNVMRAQGQPQGRGLQSGPQPSAPNVMRAHQGQPQGRGLQSGPRPSAPNVMRAQGQYAQHAGHYNLSKAHINVQRVPSTGAGVRRPTANPQAGIAARRQPAVAPASRQPASTHAYHAQKQQQRAYGQYRRAHPAPRLSPNQPALWLGQRPGSTQARGKLQAQAPRMPVGPIQRYAPPVHPGPHGRWRISESAASRQRLGVVQNNKPDPIYETPMAALVINQLQRNRPAEPDMSTLELKKSEIDQQLLRNYEDLGRKLAPAREPVRLKTRRDYMLQEMQWMASEIARERKWKRAQCRLLSKAVLRHFNSKQTKARARSKLRVLAKRKIAASHAKEVKRWWYEAEKLAQIREEYRLHELAQEAADDRLDAFVNQNVKRSTHLAKKLRDDKEDMDEDPEGTPNPDGKSEQHKSKLSKMTAVMNSAKPKSVHLSSGSSKNVLSKEWLRHGTLREYQQIGVNWLITLYENGTNGILADEMGLGKTIQTIALLAWLASQKEIWGPHLIVVPSSVVVNWESEFKRWSPKFKIVSYHGSISERKAKRQGWSAPNAFHVCVTSYATVVKDANALKRIRWHYLVLDEAHNIKNFQSQRWQTLMKFKCRARLLLTGTPLQNNLMELWSLMHFLMPAVFESQQEFKEWFEDPVNGMLENNKNLARSDIIPRLHAVLRPFLLRRLKCDVAKQLPSKTEKVIKCRLSQRQRRLYEDFMAASSTKKKIQKGSFFSLMNVLMQLRKVCNHPNIFEGRAISSSFQMERIQYHAPALATKLAEDTFLLRPDALRSRGLLVTDHERERTNFSWGPSRPPPDWEPPDRHHILGAGTVVNEGPQPHKRRKAPSVFAPFLKRCRQDLLKERDETRKRNARLNFLRLSQRPVYGSNLLELLGDPSIVQAPHLIPLRTSRRQQLSDLSKDADDEKVSKDADDEKAPVVGIQRPRLSGVIMNPAYPTQPLLDAVVLPNQRMDGMRGEITRFTCLHPPVKAPPIGLSTGVLSKAGSRSNDKFERHQARELSKHFRRPCDVLHHARVRMQMAFPEKRLIQWDCGKLQMLDKILRREKQGGHRCLIFTQMTKMLDVLEDFLNLHDYRYLRLDGSTKTQKRAELVERFNQQDQYFVFILTTRSGGLGINLTGADRVIFYDIDWNPAIDLQAQDRAHRIGQTRDVVIYKLVSTNTVEENILRKQEQKRKLNAHVIGDGCFTTDTIQAIDPRELLGIAIKGGEGTAVALKEIESAMELAEDAEDRTALRIARREQKNTAVEFQDDGPETEFQEFEAKLRAELHPVDLYALSFFGNDRSPHHSIEEIERKKQSVAVRRALYEGQCSHLSATLESEEAFLASVEAGWGVATSIRTARDNIHTKTGLVTALGFRNSPYLDHTTTRLAVERPSKRRRLNPAQKDPGPPALARLAYAHDCHTRGRHRACDGERRFGTSGRDAVDRHRPLVLGAGPSRLRKRRRCLPVSELPRPPGGRFSKDVTITCSGKIFVKYEPTGDDPYTVYANAMKKTCAALPKGFGLPPVASREDFLKLCAPHVRRALLPKPSDLDATLPAEDEFVRPDDFASEKTWPALFTNREFEKVKPKPPKDGKISILHRRGVSVLPGRRIKITKRTLPSQTFTNHRKRTPKTRTAQAPLTKQAGLAQATRTNNRRYPLAVDPVRRLSKKLEPFVPPRFDDVEDRILLKTAKQVGQRWNLIRTYMDNDPRVMGRLRSADDLKKRYLVLQQENPLLRPKQKGPELLAFGSMTFFRVIDKAREAIAKENRLIEDALSISIRTHKGVPGGVHPSHARQLALARRKLGILPDKKFTPHTLLKLHLRLKRGRLGQSVNSGRNHRTWHAQPNANRPNANPTSFQSIPHYKKSR